MRRIIASGTGLLLATSAVIIASPAMAAETDLGDLTVLATTDIHSHVADYDYFTGQNYGAKDPSKALGMEHLATAIKQVQNEGGDSVLTVDNGDANQGSSLASYYQQNRGAGTVDPMATVFNQLNYEAGVVGNHEFNYGLDALKQYQGNLNMPLLGANVIDAQTGKPALTPYTMIDKKVGDKTVKVAVVGVVTPGVETWDKANVEGTLIFDDAAQTASRYAKTAKDEGADVVIVLAHTGLDPEGVTYDPAAKAENVARSVAEQSTDVDVVIGGHSHVTDKAQEYFVNKEGKKVLFSQPGYWARFASEITVPLTIDDATGKVEVEWSAEEQPRVKTLNAADYPSDPAILAAIEPYHSDTQKWVQTVVAQATEQMSGAESAWKDTAILDFINHVQTEEVTRAVAGTENEKLPVISEVSPFSRTALFEKGDVTIADMAGLYVFDNTLMGVKLNGAQLRDYLEWSARYYKQQEPGAEISNWADVTNAMYPGDTRGIPDYSYDVLSGVNYHLDISKPVGQRVENLTLTDGSALADDQEVILALNNYRWSGGSGYPHVTDAEIVYNEQKAVRDLMIQWATENKIIDPADFFTENWSVSAASAAVPSETPSSAPSEEPSAAPSEQPQPSTEPTASVSAVAPPVAGSSSAEPAAPASQASTQPVDVTTGSNSDVENSGDGAEASQGAEANENATASSADYLAHTGRNLVLLVGAGILLLLVGGTVLKADRGKGNS